MKNWTILFLIICFCSICRAEWFDNDTRYRLEVTPGKLGEIFFVDLEGQIFPADFKNNVTVYGNDGKPSPFFFSKDRNRLFISPKTENSLFHVYFGFNKKHPAKKWDDSFEKILQDQRLVVKLLSVRINYEKSYFASDQGLLDLCKNTFDVKGPVAQLQQQMRRIADDRREIRKLEREQGRNNDQRTKAEFNKNKAELEKNIAKINKEFEEAEKKLDKADLNAKHYKKIWSAPIATRSAPQIKLNEQTFGEIKRHEFAGARFRGNLLIREEGIYEFAINSKDSSLLTIDNKLVLAWPGYHEPSNSWQKTVSLTLKPGLHELCFYYFKRGSNNASAEAAWKKPGEQHFKLLSESDFSPGYAAAITRCVDKENHSYPTVRYEYNGYFLMEDGLKADWINCWVDDSPQSGDLSWLSDETLVSKLHSSSFLQMRDSETNLVLSSKSGKFNDIPLKIPSQKSNSNRFEPEIELKIWTPSFIYDTELLDMDIEMVSGLPRESNILLKTEISRPVCFIQDETRFITLKGREKYKDSRFSPPSRLKEHIEIAGSELENGLDINFYLMIPPVVFSQHNVHFAPINHCADVIETIDGLADSKGRRVIPILHRPDLAEKRVWSLSKTIVNELSSPKKILLIADDFGLDENTFSARLKNKLAQKKIELEFLPWNKVDLGSTSRGSIGRLIPLIQKSTADRIIIIPPIRDINTGIPVRTQTRALAALVQVAQSNKNIRVIYAGSPFPSLRRTKLDNELTKSIKRMAEEYNVEFFDTNSFIRNKPNWRVSYRFDANNDLLYEPYPVHLVEEISQKIFDSL